MASQEELEKHHRTHNEILVLPPSCLIEGCLTEACLIEECLWARVWGHSAWAGRKGRGMLLIYEGGRGLSAKTCPRVGVRSSYRLFDGAAGGSRQGLLTPTLGLCPPVELVYILDPYLPAYPLALAFEPTSFTKVCLGRDIIKIRIINQYFAFVIDSLIPHQRIVIHIE